MRQLYTPPIVTLDTRSFRQQLIEANAFFNDPRLKPFDPSKEEDNPYADKEGLIEFIIGTELVNDQEVLDTLAEQKKVLIAIISIVTNYVNQYAAEYGPEYRTDVELWEKAMSMVPLMGPGTMSTQSYKRHIEGISIASDFVNFIMDVVASEGSTALEDFKGFLEKQGKALRFGIEQNEDFYKVLTIGVSIEVFKLGEKIVYVPKIKKYRVNFDSENSTWSSDCAETELVDINFSYAFSSNVFDYESLENPETKKEFDNFISRAQKAQIEEATTFFNGSFPAENPSPSTKDVKLAGSYSS